MMERQEDVFYYLTVMNENYAQPSLPDGVEQRRSSRACTGSATRRGDAATGKVRLLGSGTILREVIAAADLLAQDWQWIASESGA